MWEGRTREDVYLDASHKEREAALYKRRANKRAHSSNMRRILVETSGDPRNLVRPPARLLRRHARRHHCHGRHRRVCSVQHDKTHVVVHPYARDAVGAVHQRRSERRHLGRRKVRAHGLKVGPQPRAEELEGLSDLFPFAQCLGRGSVQVHLFSRVTGWGRLARRAEAPRNGDTAGAWHQAGEGWRGYSSAHPCGLPEPWSRTGIRTWTRTGASTGGPTGTCTSTGATRLQRLSFTS